MKISVDVAYKSLNKVNEELCGDKVELIKTKDSNIIILADGMGSGVKANILSTLTSKILGTMLINGATIDECVETIVKTLPVCQVRGVAYSTFSILQIFKDGYAYLIEFDNPACICVRDGNLYKIPFEERIIADKSIREYRFHVKPDDYFVLISDGVVHAGVGNILNFGWSLTHVADYTKEQLKKPMTALSLAHTLSEACNDLYMQRPGDDTTVAVAKVMLYKQINLFTGPPLNRKDDERVMEQFMQDDCKKIVCGGTSANIVARVLKKEIKTSLEYIDPKVPPIAYIEGIDLVTEGVLTLTGALTLLKQYAGGNVDEHYFLKLEEKNGASLLAKMLIEDCTKINLFVGKAINVAHQNPELPFDLSIRMNLVGQMKEVLVSMGKDVTVTYY